MHVIYSIIYVFVDGDQPVKLGGMFQEHSLHCSLFKGMWSSNLVISDGFVRFIMRFVLSLLIQKHFF